MVWVGQDLGKHVFPFFACLSPSCLQEELTYNLVQRVFIRCSDVPTETSQSKTFNVSIKDYVIGADLFRSFSNTSRYGRPNGSSSTSFSSSSQALYLASFIAGTLYAVSTYPFYCRVSSVQVLSVFHLHTRYTFRLAARGLTHFPTISMIHQSPWPIRGSLNPGFTKAAVNWSSVFSVAGRFSTVFLGAGIDVTDAVNFLRSSSVLPQRLNSILLDDNTCSACGTLDLPGPYTKGNSFPLYRSQNCSLKLHMKSIFCCERLLTGPATYELFAGT